MSNLFAAVGALLLAVKDVLTPRLFFLALLCFLGVAAIAAGAAWAAYTYLPPYIPDGRGVFGYLTRALEIALSFGAGLLVIVFAPAVAMIVSGFLFDVGAEKVERAIGAPKARSIGFGEALGNTARVASGALALNLLALPTILFPPVYPVVFLLLNGYLFGREFFIQAAVRHMNFAEARQLRRRAPLSIFLVGMACSVVAFIAPLVAASAMPRLVQALTSSGSGTRS